MALRSTAAPARQRRRAPIGGGIDNYLQPYRRVERLDGMRPGIRTKLLLLSVAVLVAPALALGADAVRPRLEPVRTTTPPSVDGVLDDAAWQGAPLPLTGWLTYNPLNGDTLAQETEVRVVYDDRYLYFAFHCIDPEPAGVRTNISRRDNMWNDDWVGFSLDSVGNGQTSYDHSSTRPASRATSSPRPARARTPRRTGCGTARQAHAAGIRRRDAAAPHQRPLQERRQRGDGHPLLATREPSRHVRLLAADSRREELPRAAGGDGAPRPEAAAHPRARALHHLLGAAGPRDTRRFRGRGRRARRGPLGQVRRDLGDHARRHHQPRLQPGRERRIPGRGEPALSPLLLREAPFFMEGLGNFELAGVGGDAIMRTAVHTRRVVDPSGA